MDDPSTPYSDAKPKSILKRPSDTPEKGTHLRWDEENLRVTEAQKDAKMKVDEPPTPYIRYNPELDADLQEMEDLKLAPEISSRSSSVASSPKRAQIVAPEDWISESEEEEGATEADKAKHERFRKMRKQHYHLEGQYVHKDASDIMDSDGPVDSADDDDEHGASSDENEGARKTCNPNGAASHCSKPGTRAAKGFKATYGQQGGCGSFNHNFASSVDEANADAMEI
ncbi:hypothetical protein GGI20_001951 [Coemansia sp. BCRC 34301]|nr:hypothetical protein GGI20_001951 [Coemansia sp. BCRC 34301]